MLPFFQRVQELFTEIRQQIKADTLEAVMDNVPTSASREEAQRRTIISRLLGHSGTFIENATWVKD